MRNSAFFNTENFATRAWDGRQSDARHGNASFYSVKRFVQHVRFSLLSLQSSPISVSGNAVIAFDEVERKPNFVA